MKQDQVIVYTALFRQFFDQCIIQIHYLSSIELGIALFIHFSQSTAPFWSHKICIIVSFLKSFGAAVEIDGWLESAAD